MYFVIERRGRQAVERTTREPEAIAMIGGAVDTTYGAVRDEDGAAIIGGFEGINQNNIYERTRIIQEVSASYKVVLHRFAIETEKNMKKKNFKHFAKEF